MSDSFEQIVASALDRWVALDVDNEIEAKEIVELVAGEVLQALRQHTGSDDFAIIGGQVMRLHPTKFRYSFKGKRFEPQATTGEQWYRLLPPTPQEQEQEKDQSNHYDEIGRKRWMEKK